MIRGRATPEGTAAYRARLADRMHPTHFREHRGLSLASVGLGTYLGPEDDATDALYAAAIARAMELGSNVLDAAINYRAQRSERVIGRVLAKAALDGGLRRDEIVVTTKGGFIPFDGSRPRDARAYFQDTFVRPGLLPVDELAAGCHCMAPVWLDDQIDRSRRNLGLETIDVYYLHNPETQLGEVPRPEFDRRIRAAFETLERAATDGRIGVYGTATWDGYREPAGAAGHLSLTDLLGIAREVGGESHHFRVVQLPYNLGMPEAFTKKTQRSGGREVSLLEVAAEAGLYVMTSASVLQGKLTRNLPGDLRTAIGASTDAQRSIQFVRSTPGVGTALVGMKNVAHVEENLAVAKVASLDPAAIRSLLS